VAAVEEEEEEKEEEKEEFVAAGVEYDKIICYFSDFAFWVVTYEWVGGLLA
jgi:hypothetical protein